VILYLLRVDPDGAYDGAHLPTTTRTVTYLLIDGLSQSIFEKEYLQGNLPHIQRLIKRSTYVKDGIGSFPSMTGYAFYPFITGKDATESGIYGLRWFDRTRTAGNLRNYVGRTNIHMNKDIRTDVQTVFEKYQDYYTASINTYMNRGVHHSLKTGWAHTTAKYEGFSLFAALRIFPFIGEKIAKNHFEHETLVTDLAISQLKKNPKVQWITYPSLDAYTHVHGIDSTYNYLLYHIDDQVGRIIETIESEGQSDRMIAVITDHGVSPVHTNIDIVELAKNELEIDLIRGPATHLDTDLLETPLSSFQEKDGYFVINGNQCAYLYFKDPSGKDPKSWTQKLPPNKITDYKEKNIADFLAKVQGVDLVAYLYDQNSIMILKNNKKAVVTYFPEIGYRYTPLDSNPLYTDGLFHPDSIYTKEEVLVLSLGTEYPYAVPRLFQLLSKNDGPDLVITSMPGYDLASDYELFVGNYKGGHGGIRKEVIQVPYIIYQPGEEPSVMHTMLSEELGEMVLEYLENSDLH
jgi:hypothetical protein